MSNIIIEPYNACYDKVICERSVALELSDKLTFMVPGHKYTPAFKWGSWDGKKRLYNTQTKLLFAGLRYHVEEFAEEHGYTVQYNGGVEHLGFDVEMDSLRAFMGTLGLPADRTPRGYQEEAVLTALQHGRRLLVSPTSSGKSLIMYLIMRYINKRTLIILPSIGLINQLHSDFKDYGYDSDKFVHRIYTGQERETDHPVVITTWQSAIKLPKEWFSTFDVVFGDEAHTFKAKSLGEIMDMLDQTHYRFGTTGTLDGSPINELILEGLFGQKIQVITTKELMDAGQVTDLRIKCITLVHPDEAKKAVKKAKDYQFELDYIVSNDKRNKFLRNLALTEEGNILLLFQHIDKQGKVLYDMIQARLPDSRKLFYVDGKVKGGVREDIRQAVMKEKNCIITASYGTFSTGINIPNLNAVVFCSPYKSKIKVLQSLGRGLRLHEDKEFVTLYDISDDLTWKKSFTNITYNHFVERLELYNNEQFNYKTYRIEL